MQNVVVTGASGFTGYHLCGRLVKDGIQVVALVRATSQIGPLRELGVECCAVRLWDRGDVTRYLRGADTVFHIAAAYRQERPDLSEFELVNVKATEALLLAAEAVGVSRFVHCSTVGVQGEIDDPPANENYRFKPGDHYQESKLRGELLAREHAARGLPVSVVRPVGIYGPGDVRFLKLFRPIARERFVMIGSGQTLYHLTFIDDLVQGFILAATKPQAVGEVFTIAGERYTTLNELVNLIADILGRARPRLKVPYPPVYLAALACERVCRALNIDPPLYPRRVEFFAKDRAFDISKAKRCLGYTPRVGLEEGIRRTGEWYREQGLI